MNIDPLKPVHDTMQHQIHFSIEKFCAERCLNIRFFQDHHLYIHQIPPMMDILSYQLVTYIALHNTDNQTLVLPATWWDWFKERWFPRWLEKRYPIKTRTWTFKAKMGMLDRMPRDRFPVLTWLDEEEEMK